ncbi:MAG TPA: DnaJ domain-containing protein [Terracidiphilus sp.]|nr:DnaJ domain-containing protein [Terracidiphilus sp.]
MLVMEKIDYYELMQISRSADFDTIHRVYRFLAARFHPDNPDTGDREKFNLLREAYDVLSDPERRMSYDMEADTAAAQPQPMSTNVDFMDTLQGELNRRLAVLAVLYYRRRHTPTAPEVSLAEIEKRMGFPRDYLEFTTWYLVKKGYITRADNADFTLTVAGVDFVETQRANIPVLNRMLTSGNSTDKEVDENRTLDSESVRWIVLPDMTRIRDRRDPNRAGDRRQGQFGRRATDIIA